MSTAPGNDCRAIRRIGAAFIFIAVFAVFWPAMGNSFVDWDDRDNFLLNHDYRGLSADNLRWMFTTFHMGHYQPLTWLTHGLNAEIAQRFYGDPLNPRPYHFTNNLLHAVNTVLLFFLSVRLIDAARHRPAPAPVDVSAVRGRRSKADVTPSAEAHSSVEVGSVVAAGLAALFFGIHPLRVESVAWITERRDLLSGFFILLTVLAYLRMTRLRHRSWAWLSLVTVLYCLSLISKVMGATLPVILLILDVYPLRRLPASPRQWFHAANRGVLLEKFPLLLAAVIFSMIASIGQSRNNWLAPWWLHPLDARLVQSCYGLVFYTWKTFWPTHLLPLYEMVFPLDIRQGRFAVAIGVVVLAVVLIVLLRRWIPPLAVAALCYSIMLAPVLGIMQNGTQLVADRYSYLPCMAWSILIGTGLVRLVARRRWLMVPAVIAVLGAMSILAYGTVRQIAVWHDTETFWKYLATADPGNSVGQSSYGFVLLDQGRVDQAIECFHRSIEIRPGYEQAHRNLMTALVRKGDTLALMKACDAAIAAGTQWDQQPLVATAHYRLAELHRTQGRLDQAELEYRAAIKANPAMLEAGTDLGFTLAQMGRRDEAIQEYRRVLAIDPAYFTARYNLGVTLGRVGQRDEAIAQLQQALQLRPGHEGARAELERLRGGR